jgi:hypothetical protein
MSSANADLLREEYFKLQDIIEAFDERSLQIKGWSVTISLAGMAAALTVEKLEDGTRALAFALAGIAALAFWLIEYLWKCFQWTFFHRIDAIEAAFRDGLADSAPPLQIRTTFRANWRAERAASRSKAFKTAVMLPHSLIALLGFALAVYFLIAGGGRP